MTMTRITMMIRNNIFNRQQYLLQRFNSNINNKSNMAIILNKTRVLATTLTEIPTRSFSSNVMKDTNSNSNNIEQQQQQQLVKMPSNLYLDPRSKSSPFYGLDPIVDPLLIVDNIDDDDDIEDDIDIVDINDIIDNDKAAANNNKNNNEIDHDFFDSEDEDELSSDELSSDELSSDELSSDEDEKDIMYDITKRPQPIYAIPLPQRLHVPILHFSASPINNTSNDDTTTTNTIDNKHHATEAGTIHLSPSIFGQNPIRIDILHKCVIYHRNKRRGKRNAGARTKTISEVRGSGRKVRKQKGGGVARAGHARPPHWRGGAKAHGPKGDVQDYTTKLNKKVRQLGLKMALSQKLKEGNIIFIDNFSGLRSYKTSVLDNALMALSMTNNVLVAHDDDVDDFVADNNADVDVGEDANDDDNDGGKEDNDNKNDNAIANNGGGNGSIIGGRKSCTALLVDHIYSNNESNNNINTNEEEEDVTNMGIRGIHVNLSVASKNLKKIRVTSAGRLNVYDLLKYEKVIISMKAMEIVESRFE